MTERAAREVEVEVEVQSLAPGGDAVGRQSDPPEARGPHDGRVTFVPLAAPGERVRARLQREKGRVAWGELVAIERPGPERVTPACPLYGVCGGCQWQHVSIDAQRAAKRAIVERALGVPVDRMIAATAPFGYRDRAKLVRGSAAGSLGFRARRSHAVVDVAACPLLGPELGRALPALRAAAAAWPAGTEVDLQAGREGVHVSIAPATGRLGAAAAAAVDESLRDAGVVGVARGPRLAWGMASVDVSEPDGPPLLVPAGAFAQVGREANAALVSAVTAAIGDAPGVVVELYAGSGNFTRHLVARAAAVYASDADARAVIRGRQNVPAARWAVWPGGEGAGVGSATGAAAGAVTVRGTPADSGPAPSGVVPDVVLLDPPREGAEAAALEVAQRARKRIVYVSCDPQTLGRDVRILRRAGFHLRSVTALDLMPQTFHVEVVAELDRG